MLQIIRANLTILIIFGILLFVMWIFTNDYFIKEHFANSTYLEKSVVNAVYNPLDTNRPSINDTGKQSISIPVDGTINTMLNEAIARLDLQNVTTNFSSSERTNVINVSKPDTKCPETTTVPFNPKVSAPAPPTISCDSAMGSVGYISGNRIRLKNNKKTLIVNYDQYFMDNAQKGYYILGSNLPPNTQIVDIQPGSVPRPDTKMIEISLSNAIFKEDKNQQFCWQPPPVDCVIDYGKWSDSCSGPCSSTVNNTAGTQTRTATTSTADGKGKWNGQDCGTPVTSQSCATAVCPLPCVNDHTWTMGPCEFVSGTCGPRRKRKTRMPVSDTTCIPNAEASKVADWDYSCSDIPCVVAVTAPPATPVDCVVASEWSILPSCDSDPLTGRPYGDQGPVIIGQTRSILIEPANGGAPCPMVERFIPCRPNIIIVSYNSIVKTATSNDYSYSYSNFPEPLRIRVWDNININVSEFSITYGDFSDINMISYTYTWSGIANGGGTTKLYDSFQRWSIDNGLRYHDLVTGSDISITNNSLTFSMKNILPKFGNAKPNQAEYGIPKDKIDPITKLPIIYEKTPDPFLRATDNMFGTGNLRLDVAIVPNLNKSINGGSIFYIILDIPIIGRYIGNTDPAKYPIVLPPQFRMHFFGRPSNR